MGKLPSRAWERVGNKVLSFRALQAPPFLVDNYALFRSVTSGPVAQQVLASLSTDELVGLGLVPIELRRPLGVHPLVSLADFRGAHIRFPTSPTTALDLQALGAVPRVK
jgi:TRAP-type C4-dicarboxylate transport system substrate-binding protein